MRTYLFLFLFLFAPFLSAAGADSQPDLLWWSLHNRQGKPTETGSSEAWIGTLRFGADPSSLGEIVPANAMEARQLLSAWARHPLTDTGAIPLLPERNGYTVPPGPKTEAAVTLLGARYRGKEEQFSGSSVTLRTFLYPKAIIAEHNPCTVPGGCAALALSIEDIPLEIVPVHTRPVRGFLRASSWKFFLKVLYRGQPLAECPVTIHTADDRTLTMNSDENGVFVIPSHQERPATERWEHYLFTATWFDPDQDTEHTASLRVVAPPPTFGTDSIIRQVLYMGVALAILVFAAILAAVAMTPDKDDSTSRRRVRRT